MYPGLRAICVAGNDDDDDDDSDNDDDFRLPESRAVPGAAASPQHARHARPGQCRSGKCQA